MEKSRKDSTVAINGERKKILEEAAVEITADTRKTTKRSEIVMYLIDNYIQQAVKEIKKNKKNTP